MWRAALFLAASAILLHAAEFTGRVVSQVTGAPSAVHLETRAGDLFDPAKVQHDVHTLYASGRVSDVRVEAAPQGDAVRVIFTLRRKPTVRVRQVRFIPATPGVHVEIQPGAEMDDADVQRVAAGVRKQLVASGYTQARVSAQLVAAGTGAANLELRIDKGRPVDVAGVGFAGDLGVTPADLGHTLRATAGKRLLPGIPGIWNGWRIRPAYNDDAVQSDLAGLRSFYYRRGFFHAAVRLDAVRFDGRQARITYAVEAGPRYHIRELSGVPPPKNQSEYPVDAVCRSFLTGRRNAERQGILDFSARLEIAGEGPAVRASTAIATGPAYSLGRLDFRGNHRLSEISLRRMMLLDEDAPLDQTLLRQSLARINRAGWFEPLSESSVVVNTPPGSGRARVIITLQEKKARSWNFSGPVGPMSVGGPLRFSLGSRLPAVGRGLLELSTYTVSMNLMFFAKPIGTLIPFLPNRRFIQVVTVERPLLPGQRWLSGFTIAPQFGWPGLLAGYALSQTRTILQGALQSNRGLTPDLLVTVAHDGREGILRCQSPRPKFDRERQAAGIAVNLLFSFSPI